MADAVVLYSTPTHLNSLSPLAALIADHYPSISVLLLSTAAPPPSLPPSVAYCRLPTPPLPPDAHSDPSFLMEIPRLCNPDFRRFLAETSGKFTIKAVVLDFFCNSAFEVSNSFDIPTYFCVTTAAIGLCNLLYWPIIHRNIPLDMAEVKDFIHIPGCTALLSKDLPAVLLRRRSNFYKQHLETSMTMRKSAGIIVNTFYALEVRAMEALVNGLCVPDAPSSPPIYSMGPLITAAAGGEHECLRWLDLQPSKSVVFLCFGREGVFSGEQLRETAAGLENSGHRFLWTVRGRGGERAVLPEGFVERTKGRGIVVEEWAPQRAVLSHDSVGAFVTHCGQSSVLEAVAAGVPMVGWPLYAEQRLSRAGLVEEARLALPMEEEPGGGGLVTAAEVERRIREVMESKRGEEIRRRVGEMKVSVAAAVRKGGSSAVALEKFMAAVTGRS
ncbi:chalcone 4'-O-glucosyltransferase-like [Andrographis paniculata]|uniref:chalcone 4'-O-glucosyltransferase-like n=1 Tax=Andrographis paniculata TaxID=175694 RepID=UPI0021E7E422|nr:chalcone 4'-O-glucosyltransferase-like [Andrographis paniculata]